MTEGDPRWGIGLAGWLLSTALLERLVSSGVLSKADAISLVDGLLLTTEEAVPPDQTRDPAWVAARGELERFVRALSKLSVTDKEPPA